MCSFIYALLAVGRGAVYDKVRFAAVLSLPCRGPGPCMHAVRPPWIDLTVESLGSPLAPSSWGGVHGPAALSSIAPPQEPRRRQGEASAALPLTPADSDRPGLSARRPVAQPRSPPAHCPCWPPRR